MISLLEIKSATDLAQWDFGRLPAFDPETLSTHRPDTHWVALEDKDHASGRLSLWWSNPPKHSNGRLGLVGHFSASNPNTAQALLKRAFQQLSAAGCTMAVGPMDGNTWRRYRFVTERGNEPSFFLEPDNPDEWPLWFEVAGFTPLAHYFSAINNDLSAQDPRLAKSQERTEREGIKLRQLSPRNFSEELARIYAVSVASFTDNFLYTPIAEKEFLTQYEVLRERIRPELVIMAEQGSQPAGFAFAIPDFLQAKHGPVDTVVLKTLAVVPAHRSVGLGDVLLECCQQAARALGFRRVIHALMHENNLSRRISAHYATPFRRYTLFARKL